jgi:RimJ/RimL family protein N-acetyltransferase
MYKKSKRVKLRKLVISDAEFISKNARDKGITKYSYVMPSPFNLRGAKKFIKKTQQEMRKKKAYEFGIELRKTKESIGTINLVSINYKNKNAEMGIWLAKKYWGQGLAREALNLIIQFGFKNLELKRIQARVLHKNNQTQELLKKVGFKLEGRLRRKTHFKNKWYDDLIYGILREEYRFSNNKK